MIKIAFNWAWQYILTPILMGIFFGLGNFSAYWLCHSKPIKRAQNHLYSLVN